MGYVFVPPHQRWTPGCKLGEAQMKLKTLVMTLLTFFLIGEASSHATPALIDFDERAAGRAGADVYGSKGVYLWSADSTFQSGTIGSITDSFLVLSCPCAPSPPNIALGSQAGRITPFFHNLLGQFVLPGSSSPQRQASTDFVSFDIVGTVAGGNDPWTVVIFGGDNGEIFDEVNNHRLQVVTGTDNATVTFSQQTEGIAGFVLLTSSRYEGIDNLRFDTPQLPEPASIALLGIGITTLGILRLRRFTLRQGFTHLPGFISVKTKK